MKKKFIIATLAVLSLGLIVSTSWLLCSNKQAALSDALYNKIVSEHYATPSDLVDCFKSKMSNKCLSSLYSYASKGVSVQLRFIDKENNTDIVSTLERAKTAASKGDWPTTTNEIYSVLNKKNGLVAIYISSVKGDAKKIHTLLIPKTVNNISNYYIDGNWAVITTNSTTTDPANILLKKSAAGWNVVAGPGTAFSQDEITALGIPKIIAAHLQIIYSTTIIDFSPLTKTIGMESISSTINATENADLTTLTLYSKLPVSMDNYSVGAGYINNKPYYIVTVYYNNDSEKTKGRDAAIAWFTSNNIKVTDIPIQFEYTQKADVE